MSWLPKPMYLVEGRVRSKTSNSCPQLALSIGPQAQSKRDVHLNEHGDTTSETPPLTSPVIPFARCVVLSTTGSDLLG